MTLLGMTPALLAGLVAAAAVALFLLHLLVVRPRELKVPTLLFWLEAVEETRARTLIGRFRHPRTYLFLLLVAALLLAALADPEAAASARETRHVALVMDLSASTGVDSGDAGATRLEVLQRAADQWLAALPLRDRVAVVASGRGVVAGFGDPRPFVRERLADLEPGSGREDLERALREADLLLSHHHRPQILLFTDRSTPLGAASGDERTGGIPLQVMRAGVPQADSGLAALDRMPGGGLRVLVQASGAVAARRCVIRPAQEGRFAPLASVAVPAMDGGSRWLELPDLPEDGREVIVALEPPDRLEANDRMRTWLPAGAAVRVHAAPELGTELARLLAGDPGVEVVARAAEAEVVLVAGEYSELRSLTGMTFTAGALGFWVPEVRDLPPANRPRSGLRWPYHRDDAAPVVLLRLGTNAIVQVFGGRPRRVEIAPWLVASRGPWLRSPAGVALILELCRRAAGRDSGAVVVPEGELVEIALPAGSGPTRGPEAHPTPVEAAPGPAVRLRAAGPTWLQLPRARLRVAPCPSASLAGTGTVAPSPAPEAPPGHLRLWEWLVLAALGLLLLDAWLHPQGRIP